MDSFIVVSDMRADLHQQADSVLTDDLCTVSRNIDDGNVSFFCGIDIDNVVACCKNKDSANITACLKCLCGKGSFIDDYDLGIPDPFADDVGVNITRSVIYGDLTEFFECIPGKIAGILGITVKNNNFHMFQSP